MPPGGCGLPFAYDLFGVVGRGIWVNNFVEWSTAALENEDGWMLERDMLRSEASAARREDARSCLLDNILLCVALIDKYEAVE